MVPQQPLKVLAPAVVLDGAEVHLRVRPERQVRRRVVARHPAHAVVVPEQLQRGRRPLEERVPERAGERRARRDVQVAERVVPRELHA